MVTISTPDPPEVGHRPHHFVLRLAHPQNDPRLDRQSGGPGPGQDREAPGVAGRGPDGPLQPGHRFQIVVEDVGPGPDQGWRWPPRLPLQSGTRTSTAVPGHRRRMASMVATKPPAPPSSRSSRATAVTTAWTEDQSRHGVGHPFGLVRVHRQGVTGVDQTEPTAPGASLAVDHEGGRPVGPALEDVRTAGLFADGDQIEIPHGPLQVEEVVAHPGRDPQPGRLPLGQGQSPVGIDTGLAEPDPQPSTRAPGPDDRADHDGEADRRCRWSTS